MAQSDVNELRLTRESLKEVVESAQAELKEKVEDLE
jgi:hypothetical protein